jgi:NhaP-type Na+/H+ or K+/H+ antiporter
LAATLLTYGVTELVHGYGFLAVFVASCMIRMQEREHAYHQVLHDVAENTERLLTVVLLVLLGGAIVDGVLSGLGWDGAMAGLLIVLVLRPLTGFVSLARTSSVPGERAAIAFFGVRGIGSIYCLAHALNRATSLPPPLCVGGRCLRHPSVGGTARGDGLPGHAPTRRFVRSQPRRVRSSVGSPKRSAAALWEAKATR